MALTLSIKGRSLNTFIKFNEKSDSVCDDYGTDHISKPSVSRVANDLSDFQIIRKIYVYDYS